MPLWTQQDMNTRETSRVDDFKSQVLDDAREESLPVIQKEADAGLKPFQPVRFQPVIGTLFFEGEFAVKDEDVIFHIWPWGYHNAEREGRALPKFKPRAKLIILDVFRKAFGENRIDTVFDEDMGSWFIRAKGFATNQFHRTISIDAVKDLYERLKKEA